MSTDTQELIRTFEQLPQAKRIEVADFAQFLLSRDQQAVPRQQATEQWLGHAVGKAVAGTRSDALIARSRGES